MIGRFKNSLAVLFILVIFAMWVAQGSGVIDMAGEVTGATIVVWTLVAQYYFRKKGNTENGG